MRNIKLLKSEVINFCGLATASVELDEELHIITGESGSGKSSLIIKATQFVLGLPIKDYQPHTKNKVLIPKLETKVTQVWSVDGLKYEFSRIGKQKWNSNGEYVGYEASNYNFDGNIMNETNFKKAIADKFGVPIEALPLIAITGYFNNSLDKNERRKWLFQLNNVDGITANIRNKEEYALIKEELIKGKSTDDISKILNQNKNALNKSRIENDTTLSLRTKDLAEIQAIDFQAIETELSKVEKKISSLLSSKNKENKNTIIESKNVEIAKLTSKISELEREDIISKSQYETSKNEAYSKAMGVANKITSLDLEIKSIQENLDTLNALYSKESSIELVCDKCGQDLPKGNIEEQNKKFEEWKNGVGEKIKDLKLQLEPKTNELSDLKAQYATLKTSYENIKGTHILSHSDTINGLKTQIDTINKEISELRMSEVKTEVSNELETLKKRQAELLGELGKKESITKLENQINEINKINLDLTDKEALNNKKRNQLNQYTMEVVNLVTDTINSNFEGGLKFVLFKKLSSDAQNEYEQICDAELNGVSYDSLSCGQKIQCNLLTTKGLQKLLDISMTIVKDDSGSCTYPFSCEQQLILLDTQKGKKLNGAVPIEVAYKTIIEKMNGEK